MSELLRERLTEPPAGEIKKDDKRNLSDKANPVDCVMVIGTRSVHGGDGSEAPRKSARRGSIHGPNHPGKPTV